MKRVFKFLLSGLIFIPAVASGQDDDELLDLSIEDLMNMEITSVSKKAERLQDVPSSIYVITKEDIQRSSAQNLMQLLRENVPGYWAVANDYSNADAFIRNTYEGSVLILLDGTPMYDLLFASFDYENFEIPFDRIERIEVIKGSGGTVYGANSATGVINIFTKDALANDRISASAEYAYPGKSDLNIIGTPIKNSRLSASLYGKFSSFSGFEQMPSVTNNTSVVPKSFDTGDTNITNRFTENDNKYSSASFGFNFGVSATEKLSISAGLHYNYFRNDRYYQYFPLGQDFARPTGDPQSPFKPFAKDSVAFREYVKNRLVGNVRFDYSFSDSHSIFARVSSNSENSNYSNGGGFTSNNDFLDIEVQDNYELAFNSFSLGVNYRAINYDLSDFSSLNQAHYTKNQNNANLLGLFIQDKLSFSDGKLNFYLGLKAENFSLIDDNFYFSPMAKFSFIPQENITLWGGFTHSFTTPGYNQTNVEYNFFRAESPKFFYDQVDPGIYPAYAGIRASDPNITHEQAEDMVLAAVPVEVAAEIKQLTALFGDYFNTSAITGTNIKPTSFQNYELGFRWIGSDKLSFETSFFYSTMKDGVGNSPTSVNLGSSSIYPGEIMEVYYYGNYFKGTNMGLESIIKLVPANDLVIELSHAYYKYDLEYQENDDFDIASLSDGERNLTADKYKQVPEHVLRAKFYYTLNKDWKFTLTSMYASAFYSKFGTVSPTYQYDNQRFDPLYGDGGNQVLVGGEHDNRLVLNLRIDKFFLDQKLGVFVYANDISASNFTEGINQFESLYPRQVGKMIGTGVSYRIR